MCACSRQALLLASSPGRDPSPGRADPAHARARWRDDRRPARAGVTAACRRAGTVSQLSIGRGPPRSAPARTRRAAKPWWAVRIHRQWRDNRQAGHRGTPRRLGRQETPPLPPAGGTPLWTAVEGLWTTLLASPIAGRPVGAAAASCRAEPGAVVGRSARWTRTRVLVPRGDATAMGCFMRTPSNGYRSIHRLWITCGRSAAESARRITGRAKGPDGRMVKGRGERWGLA